MGKKYIIEINDEDRVVNGHITIPFELSVEGLPGKVGFSYTIENELIPYTEPDTEAAYAHGYSNAEIKYRAEVKEAYQKGLSDAWECARKIANMPYGEEEKVFGSGGWTFIEKHTASEAIERLKAYEHGKEEIQVGDEVEWNGDRYVVTYIDVDETYVDVIDCSCGSVCDRLAIKGITKTGRHFPEIAEVLKKMREE